MDHDVIIAGGGLNGPALAIALARSGLSVALIDAQARGARGEAGFDGRAYALAQASVKLLTALGIWPRVAGQSQPMRRVSAADGRPFERPSALSLMFDSAELEEGPLGHMLEDRFLSRALSEVMAETPGLALLPATEATGQELIPGGIAVSLSTGQSLTARLLVGADGRRSGVQARAGIRRVGHDYGQIALVAAIAHERPHEGVARQVFLPTGPLAILPLPGNLSSIVWSTTEAEARTITALPDDDFLTVLRPRFGTDLGAISLAGPRFSYPLTLTLAESYIAPRIALIGDAAHGVHPIAGQGLNLGLRDVAALAECVVDAARRGEDIGAGATLERYQQWRRFDSTALALGMDTVNRLFSNDIGPLRLARTLGMGAVQRLPGLRRGFMRMAAGLSPERPRLLEGRPL